MTMTLRPFQLDCHEATLRALEEHQKVLNVLPTGSGKTILFAKLAEAMPGRTLVLAHREELIAQAVEKIHKATGIVADVEMAEHKARHTARVVVGSVQSMIRRREKYPADHFALVVVDEAHHILADSYLNTLSRFDSHAKVVGVTATPDRGDKKNLGKYFQHVAYEIGLPELVKQGYLAPILVRTLPVKIDLTARYLDENGEDIKAVGSGGDIAEKYAGAALAPMMGAIADSIAAESWDRRTVIFLPLCKTSADMAEILRERGLRAGYVDGKSVDREATLKRFSLGEITHLCNAMLLTEGWDEPSVDCIVPLRPTKIRASVSQQIGRGTRILPGKEHLLWLDFLWHSEQHSLVRPCDLIASDRETADAIKEAMEARANNGEESQDLLAVAADVEEQRLRKIQEKLKENQHRKAGTYDAMEIALVLDERWLAGWEPSTEWDERPVTDKQKAILEGSGFDMNTISCRGYASALIDRIFARRQHGLATPKQVLFMKKRGHPSPHLTSFEDAKAWIDKELAWQRERSAA